MALTFSAFPAPLQHRHHRPCIRWRRHINCCSNSSVVPQNLNEVVQGCARGIDLAFVSGHRRLQVRALVPGLNSALEDAFPYNEKLLQMLTLSLVRTSSVLIEAPRVALLFKSAGTAAAAQQAYLKANEPMPPNLDLGAYDGSPLSAIDDNGNGAVRVIVNPISARGNPILPDIETAVKEEPRATWILLNADFTADRSALGIRELDRRAAFLNTFVDVFYFRNLFIIERPKLVPIEKGVMLFVFGACWYVFAMSEDGYKEARTFETQPSRQAISDAIESVPVKQISRENAGEEYAINTEAYFRTVTLLCVAVSGLFWYLRTLQ